MYVLLAVSGLGVRFDEDFAVLNCDKHIQEWDPFLVDVSCKFYGWMYFIDPFDEFLYLLITACKYGKYIVYESLP